MDFLQDYFPAALTFYTTYYTPYAAYLSPLRRSLLLFQSYTYRYLFPTLYPIYLLSSRLFSKLLIDTPDLATLALLGVILIISLKIMDMLRRTIIYWISMALRLALWVGMALLGVYVYQRGVEQSVEDLGWVLGYLGGLEAEGDRIGQARARGKATDAGRMRGVNSRGRTRGGGWS